MGIHNPEGLGKGKLEQGQSGWAQLNLTRDDLYETIDNPGSTGDRKRKAIVIGDEDIYLPVDSSHPEHRCIPITGVPDSWKHYNETINLPSSAMTKENIISYVMENDNKTLAREVDVVFTEGKIKRGEDIIYEQNDFLACGISNLPYDVAHSIRGHGITHGSHEDIVLALINILSGENIIGGQGPLQSRNQQLEYACYNRGLFTIIGYQNHFLIQSDNTCKDREGISAIAAVLVNGGALRYLGALKAVFPHIAFVTPDEIDNQLGIKKE